MARSNKSRRARKLSKRARHGASDSNNQSQIETREPKTTLLTPNTSPSQSERPANAAMQSAGNTAPIVPSSSGEVPAHNTATANLVNKSVPAVHIPGYFTAEEHECALKRIAKLSLDLNKRSSEAEAASKACRDLAAWAYSERTKLTNSIEIANEETDRKVEAAVVNEREVFSVKLGDIVELEITKARADLGMAPLTKEGRQALRARTAAAYTDSGPGAAVGVQARMESIDVNLSVMDQVDELIAQEAGHMIDAE